VMSRVPVFDCGGAVCALAMRVTPGNAAAPAASCRNCLRWGSFMMSSLQRTHVCRLVAPTKQKSIDFSECLPAVGTHAANSPQGTFGTVPVAALNENYTSGPPTRNETKCPPAERLLRCADRCGRFLGSTCRCRQRISAAENEPTPVAGRENMISVQQSAGDLRTSVWKLPVERIDLTPP
jgi:hypothetical protein